MSVSDQLTTAVVDLPHLSQTGILSSELVIEVEKIRFAFECQDDKSQVLLGGGDIPGPTIVVYLLRSCCCRCRCRCFRCHRFFAVVDEPLGYEFSKPNALKAIVDGEIFKMHSTVLGIDGNKGSSRNDGVTGIIHVGQ